MLWKCLCKKIHLLHQVHSTSPYSQITETLYGNVFLHFFNRYTRPPTPFLVFLFPVARCLLPTMRKDPATPLPAQATALHAWSRRRRLLVVARRLRFGQ